MLANLTKTAQRNYYRKQIAEHKHNFKTIYKIANELLFRKQESPLPSITPATALADGFSDFFTRKIDKIMSHLKTQLVVNKINPEEKNETTFCTDKRFKSFMLIFHCNIESLMKSNSSKSCELDPIPTKLLKTNINILASPVVCIINKSLQDGTVCDEIKEALLHPLLKANLDFEKFPSFHRGSNL